MELLVLQLIASLPIIESQFRETDFCPADIVQWKRREALFPCPPETPYHCILMYNTSKLYEACMVAGTIQSGKVGCPWILFHKDKPILGSKNSECPVTNPDCPPSDHRGFLTNHLYQYPACFINRSARTSKIIDLITRIPSTTCNRGHLPLSSENTSDQNCGTWIVVFIVFIVGAIIAGLIAYVLRRKIKEKCMSQQSQQGSLNYSKYEKERFMEDEGTVALNVAEKCKSQQSQQGSLNDSKYEKERFMEDEGTVALNVADSKTPSPSFQQRCDVKYLEEGVYVQQSGSGMEIETSSWKKDLSVDKSVEQKSEDLVRAIYSTLLDFPNGIAQYDALLKLLLPKDMFAGFTIKNLEDLLRCNSTLFRLLEDRNDILFVIAYSSLAELCEKYSWPWRPGECTRDNCRKFHLCLFNLKGICRNSDCKLSHVYSDLHNHELKMTMRFKEYSDNEMDKILLNQYPKICSIRGCMNGNKCPYLHICHNFCNGKCIDEKRCPYEHSFNTEHNRWIFTAYGINVKEVWEGSERTRCFSLASNQKQTNKTGTPYQSGSEDFNIYEVK